MRDAMPGILLLIAALLSIIIVLRRLQRARAHQTIERTTSAHDYAKIQHLLTSNEITFYHSLIATLPVEYSCMSQVALNRLIKVQRPRSGETWRDPRWNRIAQKSIDFVIVRRTDLRVMLLIELDDSTHNQVHRMQRDTFLDTVCSHINLPILHVPVQSHYSHAELQVRLLGYLTAK